MKFSASAIRRRYDDLEKQRRAILAKITEAEAETETGSGELLELIPRLGVRLPDLPQEAQRQIYDAFQLQLHYRGPDRRLQLQVTISAALAENIDRITGQIAERAEADTQGSDQPFRACTQPATIRKTTSWSRARSWRLRPYMRSSDVTATAVPTLAAGNMRDVRVGALLAQAEPPLDHGS